MKKESKVTKQNNRKRTIKVQLKYAALCCCITAGVGIATNTNKAHQIEKLQAELNESQSEYMDLNARYQNVNSRLSIYVDQATIYDIKLSEALQKYTWDKCSEYGIVDSYETVLAMMWSVTDFTADFISADGQDYGMMLINKGNHEWLSEKLGTTNFLDAKQNIDAGVYMFSILMDKYKDTTKALMAYNMGERGAEALWRADIYNIQYTDGVLAKKELIESTRHLSN